MVSKSTTPDPANPPGASEHNKGLKEWWKRLSGWLVGFSALLGLLAAILSNLDKIQQSLCDRGMVSFCPKPKMSISFRTPPGDVASGWNVVIANSTDYSAQIVDATLQSKGNSPHLSIPVLPSPSDWTASPNCTAAESPIPVVDLKSKS